MKKRLFISKENISAFVKNLKKSCDEFIAPKKEHLDDLVFGDTKQDNSELLNYRGNSVISPRAFLMPQTQELFRIKSAKDNCLAEIRDKKKRVFYGIRPCDIKAITLMKKFFLDEPSPFYDEQPLCNKKGLGEFADIFYQEKINNSIFISLACLKRCSQEAFCHLIDAGPIAKDGFDLQLIPVGRGHLVEVGSRKGKDIVGRNKKLFSNVLTEDEKEITALLNNFAEKNIPFDKLRVMARFSLAIPSDSRGNTERSRSIKKINYKKIAQIMKENKVNPELWDDIGLRCVVCSGCITLCPTCSCFGVADRLDGDEGVRLRYCDGCPYAGFTRMAGNSIPFSEHKDHIRRFFEHKLNVDVFRYGTPSCVGCGRCIQTCPGNISIKKFIDNMLNK